MSRCTGYVVSTRAQHRDFFKCTICAKVDQGNKPACSMAEMDLLYVVYMKEQNIGFPAIGRGKAVRFGPLCDS